MTIRTRLLSLLLALVMICSLLLVSCSCAPSDDAGKENGGSGGQVKPDGGDGGDGEEDGKDDEPDEPEVKEPISMGFLLKDISINLTEGTDMQLTVGEIYFEENAEGELLGEGYGTLIEKYNGTKRSENEIIIAVFKGYVYIARWDSQAHGVASIGRIGQILKLADEKNIGRISLPAFLGMIDGAVGMNVSSLIMGAATSPDAMGNWLANELIPALGSLNSSLLLGKLDQISTKLRESLIKTEGEGEGAVSVVDLGALAKWQSELSEKTVKEIIEQIFGEGSFLDMKTAVTGALTLSVSELISNLEANGANREKLFAALDSLAAIISGGEYKTLEELLKLSSDIEDMLDDPEVAGFTVSMLLMNILGIEGEVALSMKISEFYDNLSSKTLYEIIDTENSEIKSFIDSLTESLASYGDIRYKTDGDGKVTELYITADTKGDSATLISNIASLLNFSYKDGKISLDITADKGYYSEIKNELLSYDLVKSRISWKHDAFNRGRLQLAKLVVRGKNLCVYLALDPNAYEVEKYHQVDQGDKNAYAKVPMMIRVKSDLGLRKAKFLISEMMANYEIEQGEYEAIDYASQYPYRDTKTLIAENLVKELQGGEIGQ